MGRSHRLLKMLRHGLFLLIAPLLHAQEALPPDVIFMRNGDRRPGRIMDFDERIVRLQIAPIPGQLAASVTIPRNAVVSVQFGAESTWERMQQATPAPQLNELGAFWAEQERFTILPKSPAAAIGIRYGDLLLRSQTPDHALKAQAIAERLEKEAWDSSDRALAKQIRLRAMVATGRSKEAVGEALLLAKESEDPEILIEAKFILAQAAEADLRKLEEENPRWQEDLLVRPERQRLVNEALDLYLYPYLFFGSDTATASRGLWGAVGIYRFIHEAPHALESARDVMAFYPSTPFAQSAHEYVASLPPEITNQDNEKDAQTQP